jgi:hypothetical protein
MYFCFMRAGAQCIQSTGACCHLWHGMEKSHRRRPPWTRSRLGRTLPRGSVAPLDGVWPPTMSWVTSWVNAGGRCSLSKSLRSGPRRYGGSRRTTMTGKDGRAVIITGRPTTAGATLHTSSMEMTTDGSSARISELGWTAEFGCPFAAALIPLVGFPWNRTGPRYPPGERHGRECIAHARSDTAGPPSG